MTFRGDVFFLSGVTAPVHVDPEVSVLRKNGRNIVNQSRGEGRRIHVNIVKSPRRWKQYVPPKRLTIHLAGSYTQKYTIKYFSHNYIGIVH